MNCAVDTVIVEIDSLIEYDSNGNENVGRTAIRDSTDADDEEEDNIDHFLMKVNRHCVIHKLR